MFFLNGAIGRVDAGVESIRNGVRVPVERVLESLHHRFAGNGPAGVAAHAVGQHEQQPVFIREVLLAGQEAD